jgi:tetratricopeptide (TPR) repeat protein
MSNIMHRPQVKPQSHLINILSATRDHHPNFALFLGAGSSVTSGVKNTGEMIQEWRDCFCRSYGGADDKDKFISNQPWYNKPEEYSHLFELLYDQPSQRREYIESCLKGASPSWGYIYLVNLLRSDVFNTVFTTNFDDLLNEACYQFSDSVRPIVCAHDSSISSVRITSKRPKIIKLHGDFLFDNIKNTVGELESLEANMKEKFRQYAPEFGLIVVGYAGNDRSVIDALNTLLRSDGNFPHGVYWCLRKGSSPTPQVDRLTRFHRFRLVEIDGFDEFFADVHQALGLELQPEMADPYAALARKLNELLENTKVPAQRSHPVIEADIKRIGQKIALMSSSHQAKPVNPAVEKDIAFDVGGKIVKLSVPFGLLSQIARRDGNYNESLNYLLEQLRESPSAKLFVDAFDLLGRGRLNSRAPEVIELVRKSISVLSHEPWQAMNMALPLINIGLYDLADQLLEMGRHVAERFPDSGFDVSHYFLNKLQIRRHKGEQLTPAEREQAEAIAQSSPKKVTRLGAEIILGRYREAEKLLKEVLDEGLLSDGDVNSWPIFRLLIPSLDSESIVPPEKDDSQIELKPEPDTQSKTKRDEEP